MAGTEGYFEGGPHHGMQWQTYADPNSATGYTRKIWRKGDVSNGGKPQEFFEDDYDYPRQARAEQAQQGQVATVAAQQAQNQALIDQDARSKSAFVGAQADEDARRWNATNDLAQRTGNQQISDAAARTQLAKQQFDQSRYEFNQTNGLAQARLAHDDLATGATMRGALTWIQGDMYAQGTANGTSAYLQSLRNGTNVGYGGGTATSGNPTPLTMSTLSAAMGQGGRGRNNGGTDAYGRPKLSSDAQSFTDAVSNTAQKGLANQGLGWFENQTKGQQDAYRSASDYLGRDTDSELEYYRRSRPHQSNAMLG